MIAPLRRLFAFTAFAITGLALASPASQSIAQSAPDWTSRVSQSQVGGHIAGNPAAARKLVEYMSYTCPHCAAFEVESHDGLRRGYLADGKMSFELRNYVSNPVDLTVALLARCGEPTEFFRRHKGLLFSQRAWMAKANASSRESRLAWYEGDIDARIKRIASDLGLYDELRRHAPQTTNAQIDICLANKAEQAKLTAMTKFATDQVKIEGTPSFTLNGKLLAGAYDWKTLEPLLASR